MEVQLLYSHFYLVTTDLTVFHNKEQNSYDVYIGLALLERVNIAPEDLQHKMLIGRLRNFVILKKLLDTTIER